MNINQIVNYCKLMKGKAESYLLPSNEENEENVENKTLAKKSGLNDYIASAILLIITVFIGIKFKSTVLAQFDTIFSWWGTNMNSLTSSQSN